MLFTPSMNPLRLQWRIWSVYQAFLAHQNSHSKLHPPCTGQQGNACWAVRTSSRRQNLSPLHVHSSGVTQGSEGGLFVDFEVSPLWLPPSQDFAHQFSCYWSPDLCPLSSRAKETTAISLGPAAVCGTDWGYLPRGQNLNTDPAQCGFLLSRMESLWVSACLAYYLVTSICCFLNMLTRMRNCYLHEG